MLLFSFVLTTKYLKDYLIAGKVPAKVSLHSSEKELFLNTVHASFILPAFYVCTSLLTLRDFADVRLENTKYDLVFEENKKCDVVQSSPALSHSKGRNAS